MNPYLQRLERDFDKYFALPPIPQPDPLAETEASEGACAMEGEGDE